MNKKPLYFKARRWWIKTIHWEYWPIWLVYLPVSFYYLYMAIKARSLFFFSASNPSIETGGLFFESKWEIYKLMPPSYYPTTLYITEQCSTSQILQKMEASALSFPVIAKPDRGERGWCVQKIEDVAALDRYRNSTHIPFLIQAYVALPLEFSVFYYRHPHSNSGRVTSVTLKKLLSVTGDGQRTIQQLVLQNDRAFLQYPSLQQSGTIDWASIPAMGEEVELVPYGNHVRGAMFLNYNHIISPEMHQSFDIIGRSIEGFYFGRFDLRCTSITDLQQGKNISILELNGAGAEPAHIYDPHFPFFKAQQVLAQHYRMMLDAAMANRKDGIPYITYKAFKQIRKQEKILKQKATTARLAVLA